jgi:methyltransferase
VLIRLLVCGYMAAARLFELAYSRRNIEQSGPASEGAWSRRTFPLIVAVHTSAIGGTLLFGSKRLRLPWLLLLALAQPLRFWALHTLGRRWNVRAAVPDRMEVAADGPYAFVRHPNYAVVMVELLSLPMAFERPLLALSAGLVNAGLLAIRIRDEEALLMRLPGYREQFEGKARLVPYIF